MDDPSERPGVQSYVVAVVLFAVIAIAALVLLGGQTSTILMTVSGSV